MSTNPPPAKVTIGWDAAALTKGLRRAAEAIRNFGTQMRQLRLARRLGQVTCSAYPADHDLANLPCRSCGAAL